MLKVKLDGVTPFTRHSRTPLKVAQAVMTKIDTEECRRTSRGHKLDSVPSCYYPILPTPPPLVELVWSDICSITTIELRQD